MQRIALESLITVLLSALGPEKIRQMADLYQDFSFKGLRSPTVSHPTLQINLGPWSPWGRVKRRQQEVFTFLARAIEERLKVIDQPEEDDLILGLARPRLKGEGGLSSEVIRSEILDLLFQGHEFTGNSLAWTLSELISHPAILNRLRNELDEVVGDGEWQTHHLSQLPYLDAVVQEGLRFRPTSPFTSVRKTQGPYTLGGYRLEAGTFVAVCFPALAKRDDVFDLPNQFDPENFFGKKHSPYAWSPFGGGQHQCAGKDLALLILKVALATIVQRVELKPEQAEVRPVRNAYFYEPNRGFLVSLNPRHPR